VELILLGTPRIEKVTFDPSTRRSNLDPEGSVQVMCNAYYLDEERLVVLNGPKRLASALYDAKVETDASDPSAKVIRIIRTGTSFDTKFSIKKTRDISADEQETIGALELHDMAKEWADTEESIPF